MGISREVDVDLVLGHYQGLPTAGAASFDAKDWPQSGLPQSDHCLVAQLAQSLGQPDGGGSLPFTGGCWSNPSHHQLTLRGFRIRQRFQRYLGFVVSIGDQVLMGDSQAACDLIYRFHLSPGYFGVGAGWKAASESSEAGAVQEQACGCLPWSPRPVYDNVYNRQSYNFSIGNCRSAPSDFSGQQFPGNTGNVRIQKTDQACPSGYRPQ